MGGVKKKVKGNEVTLSHSGITVTLKGNKLTIKMGFRSREWDLNPRFAEGLRNVMEDIETEDQFTSFLIFLIKMLYE